MTTLFMTRLRISTPITPQQQSLHQRQTEYWQSVLPSLDVLTDVETAQANYEEVVYGAVHYQERLLMLPSYRQQLLTTATIPLSQLCSAVNCLNHVEETVATIQQKIQQDVQVTQWFGERLSTFMGIRLPPRTVTIRMHELLQQLRVEKAVLVSTLANYLYRWLQGERNINDMANTVLSHANTDARSKQFFLLLHHIVQLSMDVSHRHNQQSWEPFIQATLHTVMNTVKPLATFGTLPKVIADSQSWFKGRQTRAQLIYYCALLQHDIAKAEKESDDTKKVVVLRYAYERALAQTDKWLNELNRVFHRHARKCVNTWREEITTKLVALPQKDNENHSSISVLPHTTINKEQDEKILSNVVDTLPKKTEAAETYHAFRQALRDFVAHVAKDSTLLEVTHLPGFSLTRRQVSLLVVYAEEEMDDAQRNNLQTTLKRLSSFTTTNTALLHQLDLFSRLFSIDLTTAKKHQLSEQYFTKMAMSAAAKQLLPHSTTASDTSMPTALAIHRPT